MFFKKYKFVFITGIIAFVLSFIVDKVAPNAYGIHGAVTTIQKDIQNKTTEFNAVCNGNFIPRLLEDTSNEALLQKFLKSKNFIFVYDIHKVLPIIWNTQYVVPNNDIIFSNKNDYIIKLTNGWYIVEKRGLIAGNKQFLVIGLIPVKNEYFITNNYLKNNFTAIKGAGERFFITDQKTNYQVYNIQKHPLFYLGLRVSNFNYYNNAFSLFLKLLGCLLFFYLLHRYGQTLSRRKGIWVGGAFLFTALLLIRIISYQFPFPINFKQFDLFNPGIYGSNFILRSLGDLIVNVFLFEWFILFIKDDLMDLRIGYRQDFKKRLITILVIAMIMIGVTMLSGFILNSLVSDSQISFEVLNFFSLNTYSVIGFIAMCGIATVYFFTMQLLLHFLKPVLRNSIYLPAAIIILTSLFLLFFLIGNSHFVFYFLLNMWMLVFLFLLNYRNLSTFKTKIISTKLIFWIFFFSVSITMVIVTENSRKELESRKHYLENLADKTDPEGERMMSITLANMKDDFLSRIFNRFRDSKGNAFLKDSLLHENFPGYLNRYDTKIYTYDSTAAPLFNPDSTKFNTLNIIVETQAHTTGVHDLFYYDVSMESFNYITRKIIVSGDGYIRGYLFIISSPKRYKADEHYPEFLNKGNEDAIENSPIYSYGIYNNRYLINSYNDYPFPTRLPKEINFYSDFYERNINGYSELWYRVSGSKLVVITKPDNLNIEAITLFAYLFCAFVVCITIINLFVLLFRSKLNFRTVNHTIHLTVRNQVHGTIILISLISFIIIGITTILFFINRYNKNDHEKLSRTINVIENDIINSKDSVFDQINRDPANIQWKSNDKLITAVNRIADIHESNLNIYDLDGSLKHSSLPTPYAKGILSSLMDPLAFFHLKKIKDAQYFRLQKIGDLQYLNNYIPLKNKNGIEFGYLNIPYYQSQSKLYEEISNFLVTIINLNAFIFLIAGIIAFFITNRITDSFFFISEKMKEVTLGKTNELIKWKGRDEIGELVKEYNRMVLKLEESAQNLAKNEREGAWREMARQVAHEIKNPLTPMKLNLQYLQIAIDNQVPNVLDISLNVTKILVEQIDHLSQIASDFSQFANINHSHNHEFDLNDVLNNLFLLYAANSDLEINLVLSSSPLIIYADKTQIQRLFTNLIQNAIQSIPDGTHAKIEIRSVLRHNAVFVSVKDNGSGIPENMRQKIFTPNFTTKSSGTGLGLAMCKGIIEKLNGKIWFDTVEDEGTTFFIEIPV